jgi:3,4-dihydroxy 2-butanone 4-phosphate synthase / GTP cyclohydrolase II
MSFASIEAVLQDLATGRLAILVDTSGSGHRASFVMPASSSTPDKINQMIFYGRGLISLAMTRRRFRQLDLPLDANSQISIDAVKEVTAGISALDRSHTIKVAGAVDATPEDIKTPGHVFPVEIEEGGCLVRPALADAAYDLIRLSMNEETAVFCEILNEKGEYISISQLDRLASELGIKCCSLYDLVEYRFLKEPLIENINTVDLPTEYGNFRLHVYKSRFDKSRGVDLALTFGKDRFDDDDVPLVRVHSEWSIANIVNRLSDPEGSYLNKAMKRVSDSGGVGAIVFLRNTPEQHTNSLFTQDKKPTDIWSENGRLKTLAPMGRNMSYGFGAQILRDLGIRSMSLLTNSDASFTGLDKYGLNIVEQVPF